MYNLLADPLIKKYADIIESQYGQKILSIIMKDVYNLNDPLFLYDSKHYYLFTGSLTNDQNIGNTIKSVFILINGTAVMYYNDTNQINNFADLSNVCVLFKEGSENGSGVLNGQIIEYTIL